MKSVMMIGECNIDFAAFVNDTASNPLDESNGLITRLNGSGYVMASVSHFLNMPYLLVSGIGTGVYGDMVKDQLKDYNRVGDSKLTAGCSYTMIDPYGGFNVMNVGDGEYDFQPSWLHDIDLNAYSYVVVTDDMFTDENTESLISFLEKFKGRIIFKMTLAFLKDRMGLYKKLAKISSYFHISETMLNELIQDENCDQEKVMKLQHELNVPLVITLADGGCYYQGTEENFFIDSQLLEVVDLSGYEMAHVGAFVVCLNVGLSLDKSIRFACDYAELAVKDTQVVLSEQENELMRNKLAELILSE